MKTILYLSAVGEISGAERSLLAILDALDRKCWHPIVAAPDGTLQREVAARNIETITLPLSYLKRPRSFRQGWNAYRTLQQGRAAVTHCAHEIRPAIIHANTTTAMLYAYGITDIPIVWQVRDLTPLEPFGYQLYRRAARVAVISTAVRDYVLHYAHDEGWKISFLPPAVDTALFRPSDQRTQLRSRLGLPIDQCLIGMIAQFVPWKRHHAFLDAFAQILGKPCHAILAGANLSGETDYFTGLCERIAHPPLSGRVSIMPWQDNPVQLLASLDIAVLTSLQEPFGRVLIESMACGVPVIAVDGGGVRDIITMEQNGLLVSPETSSLVDALQRIMGDSDLRLSLAAAGCTHVRERFSLERQRYDLNGLYSNMDK